MRHRIAIASGLFAVMAFMLAAVPASAHQVTTISGTVDCNGSSKPQGGLNVPENLQPACHPCNLGKHY